MSKSTIIINGENSGDVVDYPTDANINMVAVNDNPCTKHLDNFNSKDSGQQLLSYPCDFDHIYATSMSDSAKSKTVNSEISLLKELLLSHLDLIQQQSEQLVTKDKQISALQLENATLKLRLERMDRRVTLQKHRDVSEVTPGSNSNISNSNSNNTTSTPLVPPSLLNVSSVTVASSIENNCNVPETVVNNTTPVSRKRKQRDDTGSVCSAGSKRTNRSASWNSVRDSKDESSTVTCGKLNGKTSKKETMRRRRRKKQIKNGDVITLKKDENILMTGFQYYTPIGDDDDCFDIDEPKVNGCVLEVPSWRTRHFTSCYSMEGTENLSEDVFERRHARLEIDERRRKRWDVQRIREQRQLERLRQRQRKGEGGDDETEELTTFWPHPDEVQYIQVAEMLPVSAFGCPLPYFKPTEFSLPWLSTDKENLASRLRSVQLSKRKR